MEFARHDIVKDLVVAGAGMPGICAAIQAARLGLSVALINDRGYLGGNASAEIFVQINGANVNEFNFYSRETGIIEEIRLENLYRNPQSNRYVWDAVLLDFVWREPGIELFLNTTVDKVGMRDDRTIEYLEGSQTDSEKRFRLHGRLFLDDTGDGTVGFLSGADYRMGREARAEFGERIAPTQADDSVLLSTLTFNGKDTGRPVRYIRPPFALDIESSGILRNRTIPQQGFHRTQWYYELGEGLDQVADSEVITRAHKALVYGIWDYIKNSGRFESETYDLEYVSAIPGKRESRRLLGDYILTEDDILSQRDFPDTVGHGGWNIDLHAVKGIFDTDIVNRHVYIDGIYQIPYRTGYSRNIDNLFMAGRCMSTTHVAFGSTRVIATLCTLAQALGVAAWLCVARDTTPRGVYESHLNELRRALQKLDQYIVGARYDDEDDLAKVARITASSVAKCELLTADHGLPLDRNIAVLVPVIHRVDAVKILLRSEVSANLTCHVYHPGKPENFCPKRRLSTATVPVGPRNESQWIELPIGVTCESQYLLLELEACPGIEVQMSATRLPGLMAVQRQVCNSENVIDWRTLKKKDHVWRKLGGLPCFRIAPEEPVYAASNLSNGLTRPYGAPNLWLSEDRGEPEFIELSFDCPVRIRELVLYFDSDLDYLISHQWADFNTMPTIVRDYDILVRQGSSYEKAGEVRGNYQRVNRIPLAPTDTTAIRIACSSTNGAARFGVYQVCLYR